VDLDAWAITNRTTITYLSHPEYAKNIESDGRVAVNFQTAKTEMQRRGHAQGASAGT